jgi:CubicO group peptidase (beta-lactamase class C family)
MGKAALSRQLVDAVDRGDTPGVVALIVGRDGVLWEGAAGRLDAAHKIAMPSNAIFAIASMTKPVTTVAVMMLFEQGKLQLDDPVSKYLAGFGNLRVITQFHEKDATYETRPANRPMTIRHLLTHTSGIGYGFTNPIEHRLTEATKKAEWELPLQSDPGEKWIYGPGTNVLGMIVEKLSGEPLEDYFQQRIFKPLDYDVGIGPRGVPAIDLRQERTVGHDRGGPEGREKVRGGFETCQEASRQVSERLGSSVAWERTLFKD